MLNCSHIEYKLFLLYNLSFHYEFCNTKLLFAIILTSLRLHHNFHYIYFPHVYVCFQDKVRSREWRTQAALSHVGVSILSSAVTTIIAAIPLTQTTIQPFAKFGQIIAINTSVCILYSLTLCVALLSTIGPAFFKPNWMSFVKSVVGTVVVVGLSVLVMFIVSRFGVEIPGPNGGSLF